MKPAVDVTRDEMAYRKALDQFKVPPTILKWYAKKRKGNPNSVFEKTAGNYKCVFIEVQEFELVTYLEDIQKRLFGLTMKERGMKG